MLVGQEMRWAHGGAKPQQIYYDVFHANKNAYVDVLHLPLVDAYECLGLSDTFSQQLGRVCSLGNLNVKQSKKCIDTMRAHVHIQEKISDMTGGDCQRMLHQKTTLVTPIDSITDTFSVLVPMAIAAVDLSAKPGDRKDALACFRVFHKLFHLFLESAALRLTMTKWGDYSTEHQAIMDQCFTCLANEVNDDLVDGMKRGLTYVTWPSHYLAEHLSHDMHAWFLFTGGIPFGRSSNQVSEHLNKIIKKYLKRHTNCQVDGVDIRYSKFNQVLVRLGAERLRRSEVARPVLRRALPCSHCIKRGIELNPWSMHSRVTSRKCNPEDRVARIKTALGRAIGQDQSDSEDSGSEDEASPGLFPGTGE